MPVPDHADEEQVRRLNQDGDRLDRAVLRKYELRANVLAVMTEKIHGLSPTAKLINGFGYVESCGKPVRSVNDVKQGSEIELTLHDGKIQAVVSGAAEQEE